MELIADIFLVAGALGAGLYCYVLGRRLNKFNSLEKGVGGAVAVLSSRVDELEQMLASAQTAAKESVTSLEELTKRAEDTTRRLELQIASIHDIPDVPPVQAKEVDAPAPKPTQPMFTRHPRIGN